MLLVLQESLVLILLIEVLRCCLAFPFFLCEIGVNSTNEDCKGLL